MLLHKMMISRFGDLFLSLVTDNKEKYLIFYSTFAYIFFTLRPFLQRTFLLILVD